MNKRKLIQHHKWFGLLISFFLLMFCISGILLNHRQLISDINVSRTHAEISLSPQGAWVITDLGSTNGTYVNGRAVASQPLNEGDHIAMGSTNFVFTLA